MKIYSLGARFYGGQLDRIDAGFTAFGHEPTPYPQQADLIYVQNAWYDEIIGLKQRGQLPASTKLIFNVLDLAPHLRDSFPLSRLKDQLQYADAITTISHFVQSDLRSRAGFESTVIWNPIKPITHLSTKPATPRSFRYLFIGRVNDPAKNCGVCAQALQLLGMDANEVVTVGDQPPMFGGMYWGVASDDALDTLYNSVDFVCFTSLSEGLGLPMCEAMAAGAIPIVLRDLPTREEFLPLSVFPEYAEVENNPQSIARFVGRFLNSKERMAEMKTRLYTHYRDNWSHRLSGRGVAEAIVRVYEGIK